MMENEIGNITSTFIELLETELNAHSDLQKTGISMEAAQLGNIKADIFMSESGFEASHCALHSYITLGTKALKPFQ